MGPVGGDNDHFLKVIPTDLLHDAIGTNEGDSLVSESDPVRLAGFAGAEEVKKTHGTGQF
jgi:hypothetical protein